MTKHSNGSGRNSKTFFKLKRTIGSTRRNRSTRKPRPPRAPFLIDPATLDDTATPEPNDRTFKGLWACQTDAEIDALLSQWAKKFRKKALKALSKKVSPENRATVEAFLENPGAASIPLLTNEVICREAYKILGAILAEMAQANAEMEFGFVTFIAGDDMTSHFTTELGLHASQKQMLGTLRAMAPGFHFGVYELALFNSHGHPNGGQVLQGHGHAIIAGPPGMLAKANQTAMKHEARYAPNISGAAAINIKEVEATAINLMRVSAYLFKQPYKCMNWNPGKDGKTGHMNGSEKGDRYARYLRLAQLRTMIPFEEAMFAGGGGVGVRSRITAFVRALALREAHGGKAVLHPDAIASFWVDLMPHIRAKRWNLPIIKNRR